MIARPTTSGLLLRTALGVSLVVGGYMHAELYCRGYRSIPFIGPSFLIQAAASFALAIVVLAAPWPLRLAAAALALGSLAAFALSRTTGLFGFTEIGWTPAPQAAITVLAESLTVVLCALSMRHRPWRTEKMA
ncbi:hypothetical protein [Nocardia sp. NPDC052566]|uniref:hypothetical protein n=1 Tax=Nocardia sp. NPDC052566 TaxID=3364330 RepID=UPI0037C809DE